MIQLFQSVFVTVAAAVTAVILSLGWSLIIIQLSCEAVDRWIPTLWRKSSFRVRQALGLCRNRFRK